MLLVKVPYKYWLYFVLPCMAVVALYIVFVPQYVKLSTLFDMAEPHIKVRSQMMTYVDSLYNDESRDFIYMLLFNQKDNTFYKSLIALNVAHLFVISGLHISIFCGLIKKIFKKRYLNIPINLIFTFFIFYLTCT